MTAVQLAILTPADGVPVVGSTQVVLQGAVVHRPAEIATVPLYFRWYSSLVPGSRDHMSIHENALTDPTTVVRPSLGVGTHVLTFAASDQPGEDAAAQNATRHGGVTGGAAGPFPCVIDVLLATIVRPASGAVLSRAGVTVEAVAPVLWGDKDHQEHNGLACCWRLEPTPSDGRAGAVLPPDGTVMAFDRSGPVPVLRYHGPLPAGLGVGAYELILRVERLADSTVGHESRLPVVIVP